VPRGAAAAPIIPICVPGRVIAEELPAIHIGGYLKSSLSTPHLTRTSAA
jgi:hypothetical protein